MRSVRSWFYRTRRWQRKRSEILERDGRRCLYCGRPGFTVHHVRPIADGGDLLDNDNLATSCRDCHRDLHRPPEVPGARAWREAVEALVREEDA